MFKVLVHIGFCFLFLSNIIAQVKTIKPIKTHALKANLGIGGGITRSVLFLTRNIKQNNDAIGYNGSIVYITGKIVRVNLDYTHYKKINIQPTWYNIKASTIEVNVNFLAKLQGTKAYFYPLFGLSYNSFSGYFTGLNDFLNLSDKYKKNEVAKTNWLGLNVGAGYEHYFKQISIFGEYKMRVGNSDGKRQLNILDVCFSCGLRYNLKIPSVYKIFRGTKSRYLLETKTAK